MATVFGKLGNELYLAYCQPDPDRRRAALAARVDSATPAIQAAVKEELSAFVEFLTRGRWTEEGWRRGEEKLRRIQNDYPLVIDIRLRKLDPNETWWGEPPPRVINIPPHARRAALQRPGLRTRTMMTMMIRTGAAPMMTDLIRLTPTTTIIRPLRITAATR